MFFLIFLFFFQNKSGMFLSVYSLMLLYKIEFSLGIASKKASMNTEFNLIKNWFELNFILLYSIIAILLFKTDSK